MSGKKAFLIGASGMSVIAFAVLFAVDRYLRRPPKRYMCR